MLGGDCRYSSDTQSIQPCELFAEGVDVLTEVESEESSRAELIKKNCRGRSIAR